MKNKLKFLWIEDDPKRIKESENIKERLKVDIKFINVKGKDLENELDKILSGHEPDLILMDHWLNDVKNKGFKKGSTAAEVIREKWPECPIVCVTGQELRDIDSHKKSIYEEVVGFDKISDYYSTFLSIANSFKEIKKNCPKDVNDFIKSLKAPEDDKNRLKSILPNELKSKEMYQDKIGLLLNISKWVRHLLMKKPGFLYDRLWTATLLGLKEGSYKKVEHLFAKAKYNGIFSDENNERWWQSKVREILFLEFPESDSIYPWELGRKLPGIDKSDFSKCPHPERDHADPYTVAYTDEAAKERVQMCLRHTVSHPCFEKSLFFEEIRMMKPAE
jgi:CheY-like chemotaxis protein